MSVPVDDLSAGSSDNLDIVGRIIPVPEAYRPETGVLRRFRLQRVVREKPAERAENPRSAGGQQFPTAQFNIHY